MTTLLSRIRSLPVEGDAVRVEAGLWEERR